MCFVSSHKPVCPRPGRLAIGEALAILAAVDSVDAVAIQVAIDYRCPRRGHIPGHARHRWGVVLLTRRSTDASPLFGFASGNCVPAGGLSDPGEASKIRLARPPLVHSRARCSCSVARRYRPYHPQLHCSHVHCSHVHCPPDSTAQSAPLPGRCHRGASALAVRSGCRRRSSTS